MILPIEDGRELNSDVIEELNQGIGKAYAGCFE